MLPAPCPRHRRAAIPRCRDAANGGAQRRGGPPTGPVTRWKRGSARVCTSSPSTFTRSYPQRSPQRWRNDIPVVPHVRASSRACRGIAPARRPILAAPLRSPPATFALHGITAGHEASVGRSNRTLRPLLGTGSSPRSGRERLRTPHPRCMDLRCPHCPSTAHRQLSTARARHPQCSSELSTSRSTAGENHTGVVPSVS